ncbi:MAG: S-type pyocin family protein [Brevundimonas sp.]|uniref:S-type pyocin family protein n=1 Tax=Brevundimonas sp. TaxID=1871086 RepID=UPI00391A2B30
MGLAASLVLAGCDNGQSAVETRDRADVAVEAPVGPVETAAPRAAPVEKARWTSNRRSTANENIQRLYERNGAAFDARSADEYVDKAHAFITRPPAGTETLRRANGDTLYYQASSNTFIVATSDGTPRTMFKPDNGAAYWEEQKAREAQRGGG